MVASSGSEFSICHIESLGRTGCFCFALSVSNAGILLYDKHVLFGFTRIFDNSVLGGLPKCASNGFVFVPKLGIIFIDTIIFAKICARYAKICTILDLIALSLFYVYRFELGVQPSLLRGDPLLGLKKSLMFLSLRYNSNSRALRACAWSHLIERGKPQKLRYSFLPKMWVQFACHRFYILAHGVSC